MVAPASFRRAQNIHKPFRTSQEQVTTPGPRAEHGQAQAFSLTVHSSICTTCFNIIKLRIPPAECICVSYCSHSKQELFPYTTLTGWSLEQSRNVFPVRYELFLYIVLTGRNFAATT
jgi:hypothetical protein